VWEKVRGVFPDSWLQLQITQETQIAATPSNTRWKGETSNVALSCCGSLDGSHGFFGIWLGLGSPRSPEEHTTDLIISTLILHVTCTLFNYTWMFNEIYNYSLVHLLINFIRERSAETL